MKRSNKTTKSGRVTSGSFLKVVMPKISKDSKKSASLGKKRTAPNLSGGARV